MRERRTKPELDQAIETKKESLEAVKAQAESDAQCIRRTFNGADGRRTLKLLKERMCYQSPVTTHTKDGLLASENLQHNAALQGMYLWLRKFISRDALISVEIPSERNDSLKGQE